MTPFAIAGLQLELSATGSNLEHMRARLDRLMRVFPWVQMVVFSELAAHGSSTARAEPLPGPTEDALRELAARHGVWLVTGSLFERDEGRIYNTASVIAPGGEVVGRYRKIFPFRPYEAGVEPGDAFLVFDVPGAGRFGVSICYDMWFPETSRTLAVLGAEVMLHPSMTTTIDRDVELAIARATAATNQCYVFDINGAGGSGLGRSIIAGPGGGVVYQAGAGEELIPVEIDFDLVRRSREVGRHGLGQPLKSFRDCAVEFTIYRPDDENRAWLRRLGPLTGQERGSRAGLPSAAGQPVPAAGPAGPAAGLSHREPPP